MTDLQRKIKKLLALSQSPNENEAMAAAEKARKMLEENNLTEADIHEIKLSDVVKHQMTEDGADEWYIDLATATAKYYLCAVVLTPNRNGGRKKNIAIVGRAGNVETTKEMYGYFITTCVLEAVKQGLKKKRDQDDFRRGMAAGIRDKLNELRIAREREMQSDVRALVVKEDKAVSDWLRQNTRGYARSAPVRNGGAYANGVAAGRRVNMNKQVE